MAMVVQMLLNIAGIIFQPDNVEKKIVIQPENFVKRRLAIVVYNVITAQMSDGKSKMQVFKSKNLLKKKRAGQSIHQSDVFYFMFGWLSEVSVTLQYGKNHNKYWNEELFVKQVSFVISTCI